MGHCLQTEFSSSFLMMNQKQPFWSEFALHFAWAFQWLGIYSSNSLFDVFGEARTEKSSKLYKKLS